MFGCIIVMCQVLWFKLEELGMFGQWNYIIDQIGMFSFIGLFEVQVQKIRLDFYIYMIKNGCISMVGLNIRNIEYVVKVIDRVVCDLL